MVPGPSFSVVPKKPVMALPGLTPRLPVRVVGPELVTVELPRTAKVLKLLPRIGSAKALGAVATWKRTQAAAQTRIVLTLLINLTHMTLTAWSFISSSSDFGLVVFR